MKLLALVVGNLQKTSSLHKTWKFPLSTSSVNMAKSAVTLPGLLSLKYSNQKWNEKYIINYRLSQKILLTRSNENKAFLLCFPLVISKLVGRLKTLTWNFLEVFSSNLVIKLLVNTFWFDFSRLLLLSRLLFF